MKSLMYNLSDAQHGLDIAFSYQIGGPGFESLLGVVNGLPLYLITHTYQTKFFSAVVQIEASAS